VRLRLFDDVYVLQLFNDTGFFFLKKNLFIWLG
jgi:hypothetical protein